MRYPKVLAIGEAGGAPNLREQIISL
ncbi:uncharacterized protein METZ01_LOCUS221095 [marine metagenome]|uniref:Uncharacterized protein n=1 Tax=marine metagenome TaxID=408172 RepID=A0A382G228_9ZZZZ